MQNRLDEIFTENRNPAQFAQKYGSYLGEVLSKLDYNAIGKMIETVLDARERGAHIFFIGNGGSAATASHFANDISIGTRVTDKPFKAMALTDNVAILTAVGNDDGYEVIFTKQLQNFANPGDVLVAISASGNSPNIIHTVKYAKEKGLKVIGLTGFDGGKLRELSDIKIHVDTRKGEYGPVEDVHMFVDHLIGSYFNRIVKV
ncbi:sugar isomerase [Bdellovibrio bacteriovorus]|uniref:Sugar isomerase n=1 Tax=Bdellovibrio bacteriovorus TaxID=959 RepID=A0A150WM30_BDEBC|nr:SIS domain-containing protein [Bdellovibrio bacteriovorus]KYG64994.1 sugar isomerase [Bdellovibrio bacteriovorus]